MHPPATASYTATAQTGATERNGRVQNANETETRFVPNDTWVSECYPRIHRAAWLMTGDPWEAEDLAQETFVVALEQWHRFEHRSSEATWLYGILIRLRHRRTRTLARMRRRLQRYVDRHLSVSTEDAQTALARKQWRESVWSDVAQLPGPQRDAVTLRFAEGMTYDQIAMVLGCATGTAKTRVYHALKRLRRSIDKELIPAHEECHLHPTIDMAP